MDDCGLDIEADVKHGLAAIGRNRESLILFTLPRQPQPSTLSWRPAIGLDSTVGPTGSRVRRWRGGACSRRRRSDEA